MNRLLTVFISFFVLACKVSEGPSHLKKGKELADKYIIADGHVDLPYRLKVLNFKLEKEFVGIPIESKNGDFDYVRAKKGGLDAPFMSIYIPANKTVPEAKLLADSLIAMIDYIGKENHQYFEVARTPAEIQSVVAKGKIALPMGMENGSPISEIGDVALYRNKGISYVTLTHSKDNDISDSSYDTTGTWGGLSPFGKEVVAEMNRVGMMVDVSHISDKAFYDVLSITKVPVIASHSSARKFTPGWERNMSDEMIAEMKKNGGVIMVSFGTTFLDSEVAARRAKYYGKLVGELRAKGVAEDKVNDEANKILAKDKSVFSDVSRVADHIDHIVSIAGVDHVGFGSDFDGVGDTLPTGLKDVADYPNLLAELVRRGYSDKDIEKICSGNVFRVWNQILDYAKK